MADNRLILLGTKGGPRIGKNTSWPTSNLLVVEGKPYLIDAGLGVTRRCVMPATCRLTLTVSLLLTTIPITTLNWVVLFKPAGHPAP